MVLSVLINWTQTSLWKHIKFNLHRAGAEQILGGDFMIETTVLWVIKFMIVSFIGNVVAKLIKNPRRYFGI